MNITQKHYNKIHLNYVYIYICVVTSDKILFSCIRMSILSCIQIFFSKMKLVKTLLHTELKQTNLEIRFHISIETPKEGCDDTVFQNFIDELKLCHSDM